MAKPWQFKFNPDQWILDALNDIGASIKATDMRHKAEIAAKDAEIEELTRQLANRETAASG